MLNRRQLLKASAATMLLHTPVRAFSRTERGVGVMPSPSVIYDTRFPETVAFAARANWLGASVRGIRGDITELWYEMMLSGPGALGPLAGLTQESDFFLLHQICIAQGYRLAFHGEHTYHTDGVPRIEHHLQVPAHLAVAVKTLEKSDVNWPRGIADIVTRSKPDQHKDATFVFNAPLVRPKHSPGHLVSWVIE